MKTVLTIILGVTGVLIAIPVFIMLILSIMGFGAICVTVPELALGIIIFFAAISIPGIIIGMIVSMVNKK